MTYRKAVENSYPNVPVDATLAEKFFIELILLFIGEK